MQTHRFERAPRNGCCPFAKFNVKMPNPDSRSKHLEQIQIPKRVIWIAAVIARQGDRDPCTSELA
jgi:hypothetical protein